MEWVNAGGMETKLLVVDWRSIRKKNTHTNKMRKRNEERLACFCSVARVCVCV